jgi:alcohol dehydrogenase
MLLPNEITYEQAAPVFCAGYTVWSGLRAADPKPHERIAVIGIGGLGHLGIQYSKASGFETIAFYAFKRQGRASDEAWSKSSSDRRRGA